MMGGTGLSLDWNCRAKFEIQVPDPYFVISHKLVITALFTFDSKDFFFADFSHSGGAKCMQSGPDASNHAGFYLNLPPSLLEKVHTHVYHASNYASIHQTTS